jgi:hypothetical protein
MAFKGFGSGVQDQLNSYYLPQRILTHLYLGMEPLFDKAPQDLDCDKDGWFKGIKFEDPENAGHTYKFDLSIARNDMDFWICDVSYIATDEFGDVISSSSGFPPVPSRMFSRSMLLPVLQFVLS